MAAKRNDLSTRSSLSGIGMVRPSISVKFDADLGPVALEELNGVSWHTVGVDTDAHHQLIAPPTHPHKRLSAFAPSW